jgi:4-hydroxy-3-polyprenylbenzoate decarboxylase
MSSLSTLYSDALSQAPLVVAITGASGSVIGFRFVKAALEMGIPVELVMTEKSLQVIHDELDYKVSGTTEDDKAKRLLEHLELPTDSPLKFFGNHRLDAPPASGTHLTRGMVIVPCSMGTLGRIAAGIGDNLVARSADVTLKEGRPLVLVPRESPLNQIHLRNMLTLSQAGAHMVPPMLTFYLKDFSSVEGQVNYVLGKIFDVLRIPHQLSARWGAANGGLI